MHKMVCFSAISTSRVIWDIKISVRFFISGLESQLLSTDERFPHLKKKKKKLGLSGSEYEMCWIYFFLYAFFFVWNNEIMSCFSSIFCSFVIRSLVCPFRRAVFSSFFLQWNRKKFYYSVKELCTSVILIQK